MLQWSCWALSWDDNLRSSDGVIKQIFSSRTLQNIFPLSRLEVKWQKIWTSWLRNVNGILSVEKMVKICLKTIQEIAFVSRFYRFKGNIMHYSAVSIQNRSVLNLTEAHCGVPRPGDEPLWPVRQHSAQWTHSSPGETGVCEVLSCVLTLAQDTCHHCEKLRNTVMIWTHWTLFLMTENIEQYSQCLWHLLEELEW